MLKGISLIVLAYRQAQRLDVIVLYLIGDDMPAFLGPVCQSWNRTGN